MRKLVCLFIWCRYLYDFSQVYGEFSEFFFLLLGKIRKGNYGLNENSEIFILFHLKLRSYEGETK